MAEYKVSETTDGNKVFLVKRSKLVERFDVSVYKQLFNFKSNIYPICKLSDLAFINPTTKLDKLDPQSDISFIPMEAVSDKNGNIKKLQTKKVIDSKGFTRFRENDLIWAKITPCMQNGKSAIVRNTLNGYACGSTEFFIIRPKNEKLLIDYIHFILRDKRILDNAQNFFGGSAGQQRVSKDFLINFQTPLPPIEVQQNIVNLINSAYTQKQQKELQAKELLKSIDTYLLKELGIILPENNNSLENRIFISSFSELSGGRFDIFAIFNKDNKIEGGVYENKKLKLVANLVKGQSITSDKITEGNYPVIAGGQSSPYSHNIYNVEGNVITVSASGAYSGYVWYHTTPIFASDCTVIQSKNEDKVITLYLSEMLKTKQKEIYNLQQGAGQPHVYAKDLEKLNIPIPPLKKQIEIVNHIQVIRNKAKQLQEDAKDTLEEAKNEVEKMILG